MKKLLAILCSAIALAACKKSNVHPYQHDAVLTGYDMRLCPSPACGGLLLTIKSDTPYYFHTNSTLAELGISESTKFPINVSLNYKPDTGILKTFHYIIITQIKVVK